MYYCLNCKSFLSDGVIYKQKDTMISKGDRFIIQCPCCEKWVEMSYQNKKDDQISKNNK